MVLFMQEILSPIKMNKHKSMFITMDPSQVHNSEWKKQVAKGYIQYDAFM